MSSQPDPIPTSVDATEARARPPGPSAVLDPVLPAVRELDFDVRYRRDLFTRRYWRKQVRRAVRVMTLVGLDVALVWIVASLVVSESAALPLFALAAPILVLTQALHGNYGASEARRDYAGVVAAVGGSAGIVAFIQVVGGYPGLSLADGLTAAALVAVGAAVTRRSVDGIMRMLYRASLGRKRTLLVAGAHETWAILDQIRRADIPEYSIVGHLVPDIGSDPTAVGSVDELSVLIEEHDVEHLLISSTLSADEFRDVLRQCFLLGVEVSIIPGNLKNLPYRVNARELWGWPLLELKPPRLHILQVGLKRVIDVLLASIGILVGAPLYAAIAVAIKVSSPGPVLFRQPRPGLGGKPFSMLKFRTMRPDAEELLRQDEALYQKFLDNDCKLPEGDDPRVFPVGAWLRKTSLDELPQLMNVLRGDMSIVGPRPLVGPELENYGEWADYLLSVKPGLTGYWQVNGRSSVTYPERAQLDIHYIRSWSLLLDLKIIAATVPLVFKGRGAH